MLGITALLWHYLIRSLLASWCQLPEAWFPSARSPCFWLPLPLHSGTHILDYTRGNRRSMPVNGSLCNYDYVQPCAPGTGLNHRTMAWFQSRKKYTITETKHFPSSERKCNCRHYIALTLVQYGSLRLLRGTNKIVLPQTVFDTSCPPSRPPGASQVSAPSLLRKPGRWPRPGSYDKTPRQNTECINRGNSGRCLALRGMFSDLMLSLSNAFLPAVSAHDL